MQLPSDQSPFPENEACKRCMLKPCRELFRGRVYPGKMIFVHRREFMSWPCHQPDFLKQKEETETAAALTDDIEVITGSVEINNPRWEPEDGNGPSDSALMGDTIRLLVDVKNYPDGASVSFDIYDVTESPPLRIATVNGKNEQGTASALWTVEDPQERGEALKLEFEGIAKSKASGRCPVVIELLHEFEFTLFIDPEDPASCDDKVILKGIDSDYEQIKTVADDKIPGDGMLIVGFIGCKKGDSYRLIHDDGEDQHIITEETVYGG